MRRAGYFCGGNLTDVGRIYQQIFIDACVKATFCPSSRNRKTLPMAADLFDDGREVALRRVLTDRGTGYWDNPELTSTPFTA